MGKSVLYLCLNECPFDSAERDLVQSNVDKNMKHNLVKNGKMMYFLLLVLCTLMCKII